MRRRPRPYRSSSRPSAIRSRRGFVSIFWPIREAMSQALLRSGNTDRRQSGSTSSGRGRHHRWHASGFMFDPGNVLSTVQALTWSVLDAAGSSPAREPRCLFPIHGRARISEPAIRNLSTGPEVGANDRSDRYVSGGPSQGDVRQPLAIGCQRSMRSGVMLTRPAA